MRVIKYKKSIKIISLITVFSILTGCSITLMDPKGAISVEQKKLIITSVTLMLIIVIPVIFMTIFFAIKYRENNKYATYRPNWDKSHKIELFCWTIPIFIIFILAIITWKTTHKLDPYKPLINKKNPITIQVIASDWKWIFIYPEKNIATINEIAFPINVPINFKVTSASVMNSFFIPALGSQIYAMAGMQSKLHLIANKPGIYKGFSSSYSGHGFSDMKFNVITTINKKSFEKWIEKVKKSKKNINSISQFNELAKPSYNVDVTYFSNVKANLYEDIISKFGHTHHIQNTHQIINSKQHSLQKKQKNK
ncbi:ubiquinol oxidase subunit II [Arsenophonus symbiont of Ornithomya chloropus]|uniref:ubiquinol oxidase subunit II n=1 Tax=Arsenophonus symbiont of Ornithomya chloropus TaxID=634121 RepID=UPI0032B2D7B0